MSRQALPVGLAGLGQHGMRYARHLLAGDVRGARLVAVSRRDETEGARFARAEGLRFHPSVEELAADPEVELLVVVLPPGEHPRALDAASAARKALLLEKPLATGGALAQELSQRASLAGLFASVAQTLRYHHVIEALRARLGALGTLHMLSISQRFEPTDRAWLDDPRHGGLVLNTGVHGVDLALWLSGARSGEARGFSRRLVTKRAADAFAAALLLEPGELLVTLDNSRATAGRSARIELVGERGQLSADLMQGHLVELVGREATPLEVPPPRHTVAAALADVVAALREGREPPVPLDEAARAVTLCDKLRAACGDLPPASDIAPA